MPAGYTEVINFLRGGLNTALDPSNIGEEQLQEATGIEYRPPRQGLFAVAGRTRFDATGSLGAAKVHGLVFTQFDVSATSVEGHRLLAFCGTSAFGASANSNTGTFATIRSGLAPAATSFGDGVHYGNNWFFYNGTDPSWAIFGTNLQASAQHGMFPVTGVVTAAATAIAGATPDTGDYQIWFSEYGDENGIVGGSGVPAREGAFTGTVATVTVSAAGVGISFTYPAAVSNTNRVFFRPYVTLPGGKFPFGFTVPNQFDVQATSHVGVTTFDSFGLNFTPVASAIALDEPYPVVQPPGGIAVSQNGAPPTPYDMAVFQDSIVVIDVNDRQRIKYSAPDAVHYFPSTYYIPFETEEQDTLNALEVCNNALLVFSSWYGFRVDDLPRATDGDEIFAGRSRAKEPFSHHHGSVSSLGTAVFDIYGSGQLCMFACRDGLHLTDGFKTDYGSPDLDWAAEVDLTRLSRSKLVNNPKRHRVEFYYFSLSLNGWARLDFYYYPQMLDAQQVVGFPKLPMLGPNLVPGPAAAVGTLGSDWQTWCGNDNTFLGLGSVWLEATGTTDNALLTDGFSTNVNKRWRTRDWYHAGQGGEAEIERVYLAQAQTTASGSYTVTAYCRTDDLGTYISTGNVDQSLKGNQPVLSFGQTRAQSVSLRGAKDDGGPFQEINYIVWVVKDKERLMSAKSSV